jgi:5-methylthioadenosine/S-adenosylhomocysteine deaminase
MSANNDERHETNDPARPLLIKGGCVLTFDDDLGDHDRADVLIVDGRIAAVAPNIDHPHAQLIDAAGTIVMPGFVDTHRHLWEGVIRNLLPDCTLMDYLVEVNGRLGPAYRPQDAKLGNKLSALGALNAGVTTVLDWSHIQNTPEHTEATIEGLRESGIRAVFGYGPPSNGKGPWWKQPEHAFPGGIGRLRATHFNSDDQLLTLALSAFGPEIVPFEHAQREWQAARDVGARIAVHVGAGPMGVLGKLGQFSEQYGLLGPDTTYIHCGGLSETEWKLIADTGGSVSLAGPVEMQMGHVAPPVLAAVRHGLAPSLSVDVECSQPSDFFTQMRSIYSVQRMLVHDRMMAGDADVVPLMTTRDVLRWATINGAKANGLAHKVGSLSIGKDADLIMLRTDRINVMPLNNAWGSIVLGMDTSNVDTVLVAGRIVKQGGTLLGVDIDSLRHEIEESRDHVLATAGYEISPTAPTACNVHAHF